jgi:hypothetical protein
LARLHTFLALGLIAIGLLLLLNVFIPTGPMYGGVEKKQLNNQINNLPSAPQTQTSSQTTQANYAPPDWGEPVGSSPTYPYGLPAQLTSKAPTGKTIIWTLLKAEDAARIWQVNSTQHLAALYQPSVEFRSTGWSADTGIQYVIDGVKCNQVASPGVTSQCFLDAMPSGVSSWSTICFQYLNYACYGSYGWYPGSPGFSLLLSMLPFASSPIAPWLGLVFIYIGIWMLVKYRKEGA